VVQSKKSSFFYFIFLEKNDPIDDGCFLFETGHHYWKTQSRTELTDGSINDFFFASVPRPLYSRASLRSSYLPHLNLPPPPFRRKKTIWWLVDEAADAGSWRWDRIEVGGVSSNGCSFRILVHWRYQFEERYSEQYIIDVNTNGAVPSTRTFQLNKKIWSFSRVKFSHIVTMSVRHVKGSYRSSMRRFGSGAETCHNTKRATAPNSAWIFRNNEWRLTFGDCFIFYDRYLFGLLGILLLPVPDLKGFHWCVCSKLT
jgi:hypothetical protein